MGRLRTLGFVLLGMLFAAAPARALIWTEVGDAGDLPGSAQVTTGSGTLTNITGSLLSGSINDVDLYLIYVNNPSAFSAKVLGTVGVDTFDTQLFLFDAAGLGVEGNDDITALANRVSFLTPGNSNAPSVAGLYYLAISSWNNEPNGLGVIFPDLPDTVVGPISGAPALSGWSGGGVPEFQVTNYDIQLTDAAAAAVPEPATLLLLGSGLTGLVWRAVADRAATNGGQGSSSRVSVSLTPRDSSAAVASAPRSPPSLS